MRNVGISFLAGCIFLTGCAVVVDDRGPPPPPREPDRACTMIYDPVCGERRGIRQTYGNACEARQDRARIVHPGECRRERRKERRPRSDEYSCPQVYEPVCGTLNGETRTFGNACTAGQQGAQVLYEGECRGGRGDRQRPDRPNIELRPM